MSDILSVLLAKYQVRRTKKQKDDQEPPCLLSLFRIVFGDR